MWIRFSLIFLLSGCAVFSPENRIERLCKKNPELCEYEQIDTQVIVREYTPLDTQKVTNKVDSFIIHKDRVTTRIYRNYDTIIVQQEQQPDTMRTIIKERSVVINKMPEWSKWLMVCLGFALLFVFLIRVR